MKHIKAYEKYNKQNLEVGDYVIIKMWGHSSSALTSFINNNIGQVAYLSSLKIDVTLKYDNIPNVLRIHFTNPGSLATDRRLSKTFHSNEIEYYSKDKKEMELMLKVKKYNL